MKQIKRRVTAILLALCLCVQCLIFLPVSSDAATRATHSGSFSFGGISFLHDSTLEEVGDGTYRLTLNVHSAYSRLELNTDTRTAENGTYRVSKDGYYFVELWGADGADGADTTASNGSLGGRGGAGGYVYAEMYLKKNQVLYYTLGGNGTPSYTNAQGGGANGDGGHHGTSGGDTVGGGGGYSALFFFDVGEIDSKYGTRFITEIDEADRTSRYLMIAGGGGGGGAGNGTSLIGTQAVGRADGGAGGGFSSPSGVISGVGVVSGTFYAGADGKSSGSSSNYIGRGGTNLPGRVPETWITGLSGHEPNDWAGTAAPGYEGGAGGSGNLRGGGGGAGFAGGSGGVMTGSIIPTNVGGGGGGSSFVASSVNGSELSYQTLSEAAQSVKKTDNPSDNGGAFAITYLGEIDESFLGNLNFSAHTGSYFEITNGAATSGTLQREADGTLYLYGASLLDGEGKAGGSLTISLIFKPINGFAGGNNVPFMDKSFTCYAPDLGDGTEKRTVDLGADCKYVNVPLNLPILAHSFRAGEPGELFYAEDFYTDTYADVRDSLASDVRYDFIESVSSLYVLDPKGNRVTGEVAPMKTTAYRVCADVDVKDTGVAVVGKPVSDTTVYAYATVDVMNSVSDTLGYFEVTYTKGLTYNGDGTYTFSLNVTSAVSETGEIVPDEGTNHHQWHATGESDSFEHPVAVSGYYLIRLWGGDGGSGADNILLSNKGGAGGEGGYVEGYMYLERGWYVKGTIGGNGGNGSSYSGGGGGDFTYAQILDQNKQPIEVIAVAAGGGGGGGSYLFSSGKKGASPSATTSVLADAASYAGSQGEHGRDGGAGGAAPNNYKHPDMIPTSNTSVLSEEAKVALETALAEGKNTSSTGGAFLLHFLMSDRSTDHLVTKFEKVLSEYTLDTLFSKYFTVSDVRGEDVYAANGALSYSYTPTAGTVGASTAVRVSDINPEIYTQTVGDGEHEHVHANVDFTILYTLVPVSGFMGGNDVPLLESAVFSHIQYALGEGGEIITSEPSLDLLENVATDYANVAVPEPSFSLVGQDVFVSVGDTVEKEELFLLTGDLPSLPNAENAWLYDFVTVTDTLSSFADSVSPDRTTTYSVSVGIEPSAPSTKANAGPDSTGYTVTAEGTVYIGYRVVYELTDLTTSHQPTASGIYYIEKHQALMGVLTPSAGHHLPLSITVTVGDRVLSEGTDYAYDPERGTYHVFATSIDGDVTVKAEARGTLYTLHFVYMPSPGATEAVTLTESYEAGASLSSAIFHTFTPDAYTGYRFLLDFGNGVTTPPDTMPEGDLWVMGLYVAQQYTLTVEYRDANGNTLADAPDHVEALLYGASYAVPSPVVSGYLADILTVSGVMGASDTVIRVTYTENLGALTVVYFKELSDGSTEQIRVYTDTAVSVGSRYEVVSEPMTGYTPDLATVSGVMTEAGVTVYVTYYPNSMTLSFDTKGGTAFPSVTVKYDRPYGYFSEDGTAFSYGTLPTPIRVGYVFEGWYLGSTPVNEETVVATDGDHTLTARFRAIPFTVTVQYLYTDGTEAAPTFSRSYDYESTYTLTSPALYGYTPDKASVTGTVPAQNLLITVIYTANGMTLLIEYRDGMTNGEIAPSVTLSLLHGEEYSVSSPVIEGYDSCSADVVSGVADAPAPHTERVYTVYYYVDAPTVSVTVRWGALSFDLTGRGAWNPETHEYAPDTFSPAEGASNLVTVENDESSTVSVTASFAYTAAEGYGALSAYFTAGMASDDRITESGMIAPGTRLDTYVWVEGNMPTPTPVGSYVTGTCTVTLKGGLSE